MAKKAFVYDGTNWVDIAQSTADLSTYQKSNRTGLQIVVPTSVTGGTVSANGAVTIGSGVTSVSVNGCFSSTYDNYKIMVSGGVASSDNYIGVRLISAGTQATTQYYQGRMYSDWATTGSGNANINNSDRWDYAGFSNTDYLDMTMDLMDPFLVKKTRFSSAYSATTFGATNQGRHNVAASYDGLWFGKASGTMTGGTIRVYGYNNGV